MNVIEIIKQKFLSTGSSATIPTLKPSLFRKDLYLDMERTT